MTIRALRKHLPRPSLSWMSEKQIKAVRDQIITLYLAPDEALRLRPPKHISTYVVSQVLVFAGQTNPCFQWKYRGKEMKAWLKVSSGRLPYWDLEVDGDVTQVRFCEVPICADIIKALWRYFPFLPTDNHLQKNGVFVA